MPWIWAAFMPHPPVMVPEVGRGRESEIEKTRQGLHTLQDKLLQLPEQGRPDVLLILSPHQPYAPNALFINDAPKTAGGLSRFGAPEVSFNLKSSSRRMDLARYLAGKGFGVAMAESANLTPDHGSVVPLYFLSEVLGAMPDVVIGNPVGLSPAEALNLGRSLAEWDTGKEKWALLASGDLSHKLSPIAPAGFCPEGFDFDQDVMEAFNSNNAARLIADWPPQRLQEIGECGFRSALAMMGLAGEKADVFSHEGPFGVGYGVSLWINPKGSSKNSPGLGDGRSAACE